MWEKLFQICKNWWQRFRKRKNKSQKEEKTLNQNREQEKEALAKNSKQEVPKETEKKSFKDPQEKEHLKKETREEEKTEVKEREAEAVKEKAEEKAEEKKREQAKEEKRAAKKEKKEKKTELQKFAESLPHPLPKVYFTRVHLLEIEPERAFVFYEVSPSEPAFLGRHLRMEIWTKEKLLFQGSLLRPKDGFDLWLPKDNLELTAKLVSVSDTGEKVVLAVSPPLQMGKKHTSFAKPIRFVRRKPTFTSPPSREQTKEAIEDRRESVCIEVRAFETFSPLPIPKSSAFLPFGLYSLPRS